MSLSPELEAVIRKAVWQAIWIGFVTGVLVGAVLHMLAVNFRWEVLL